MALNYYIILKINTKPLKYKKKSIVFVVGYWKIVVNFYYFRLDYHIPLEKQKKELSKCMKKP